MAVAVGSGRDETVRSFSKCLRERERACGRLAKNEKALKLKRGKKNSGKILGLGGKCKGLLRRVIDSRYI